MIADNVRNIAAQGTCVLVISHDLVLLERVCTCQLDLGRKNASVAQ
jgi:ATPase subunit of ABC transporter with duplicated ATPase domains